MSNVVCSLKNHNLLIFNSRNYILTQMNLQSFELSYSAYSIGVSAPKFSERHFKFERLKFFKNF